MIRFGACPRCGGAVIDEAPPLEDSPMCITCGWRRPDVPVDIQAEVTAHLGKKFVENRYTHRQIGKGKAPLSGWERTKRLREMQKRTGQPDPGDSSFQGEKATN